MHHGGRHNHCFTSPIYRKKVSEINRLIAERYKNHPALIAWHLSNEYGGECFCAKCRAAFREWLKKKYASLDNLNHEWWTAFWAHTYTDWEQIEPPSTIGEIRTHGLTLDWKRFVTDQTIDFMKHERDVIKSITPNIPVTTNLMGFYNILDYQEDFYQGMPAFTVNDYGKGKAYYIAFRSDANCTDKIVSMLLNDAEISSSFDGKLPYGVTAHSRSDEDKKFVFIQNFTHNIQTLKTQKNGVISKQMMYIMKKLC